MPNADSTDSLAIETSLSFMLIKRRLYSIHRLQGEDMQLDSSVYKPVSELMCPWMDGWVMD